MTAAQHTHAARRCAVIGLALIVASLLVAVLAPARPERLDVQFLTPPAGTMPRSAP